MKRRSASPTDGNVLAIFAKAPAAGQVKTRLADGTSPDFAARVADAFLRDTIRRFSDFPAERYLVYSPPEENAYFTDLSADRFILEQQALGDLGERMHNFLLHRFRENANRVVIIGADSPTLPVDFVAQAFEKLHRVDVVLGPATDGGYYLLGCGNPSTHAGRSAAPSYSEALPIFDGIVWSEPTVLAETVGRVRKACLRLAVLPPWYDVDTLADWEMLCGHIHALRLANIDPRAPATEALMTEHPVGAQVGPRSPSARG